MSKLDSFIRRMQAQRDCLNFAAGQIARLPGPVFELGLGNGRTYDHLRELLPEREIYVFDRRQKSLKGCTPPDDHFFMGNISETLPVAFERFGRTVALVHNDLGTSDPETNAHLGDMLASLLAPLVRPGGIVASNYPLTLPAWTRMANPPGVKSERYFLYQAA